MKILLYYIGKARDANSNGIADEFVKRTSRYIACEMREIDPRRFDLFAKHAPARKVFLDPAGKRMDSAQFTALVSNAENSARDLVFLIGGRALAASTGVTAEATDHYCDANSNNCSSIICIAEADNFRNGLLNKSGTIFTPGHRFTDRYVYDTDFVDIFDWR